MLSVFSKNAIVPLLLRFTLAAIFIFHGLQLVSQDNQYGATWMNKAAQDQGQEPPPAAVQLAVAWGELLGGVAMVFGFLTRLAAIGLIIIMAGAVALVHWEKGFDIQNHGFEYNFAIIVICLCLVLGGPGPFAVDWLFRRRKKT
jgi:putative oxidoreductase